MWWLALWLSLALLAAVVSGFVFEDTSPPLTPRFEQPSVPAPAGLGRVWFE